MKRIICLVLVIASVLSITIVSYADHSNTHQNTGNHADDFVAVALTQVGYSAEGKSKYSDNENWNADFIGWVAREAGIPDSVISAESSAGEMYAFFAECNRLCSRDEHTPGKGDIVFFGTADNITACAIVLSSDDEYITAIIGDDNGKVNKKLYASGLEKIYAYATPDFSFKSKYEAGTYITTASTLNLRAGAGTSNKILAKIPMGTIIEITSFNGDWGYTSYNGVKGWISMEYADEYEEDTYHNIGTYAVKWKVIDVSKWQGKIDWTKVAEAGFKGVIIRIGLRGSVSREILIDDKFLDYYEGAKAQGLHVGCYFYSAAKSVSDAEKEAEFIIKTIKENNIELDMPAYLDMEDKVVEKCGKKAIFNMTKAFFDKMDEANIYSGVYCSAYWAKDYYNQSLFNTHALWIADWDGACDYKGEHGMWQYSERGSITGIETKYTDLNTCYVNYPKLIEDFGYNREKAPETETETTTELTSEMQPETEFTTETTTETVSEYISENVSETDSESESENNTNSQKILIGDVDRNGIITASDARLALRISARLHKPTAYESLAADINGNKTITAADARIILRIAARLESADKYQTEIEFTEYKSETASEFLSESVSGNA